MQAIARELGLARATMHRWFQTRELLLGEVLATLAEQRLLAIRRAVGGSGAPALLETLDRFNREIAATRGMRALFARSRSARCGSSPRAPGSCSRGSSPASSA